LTYISVNFIYFLIIFLLAYSMIPQQRIKKLLLLAGNLCFYWWAGKAALAIIIGSAVVVYACARGVDWVYAGYRQKAPELSPPDRLGLFKEYKKKSIYIVAGALALLLGFLIYVKAGRYLGWEKNNRLLIVPLGISYYTLSMVGYLIDIYRDKVKCERNILSFMTCVTFFPHIIQGPISRYDKLLQQINNLPGFEYERLCNGLQLMLWGYLKKLVLADTLYLYTTNVFSNLSGYRLVNIVVAMVLYAVQLYADFSGCIDIVSGIAQIMGINLEKNFERPFFSQSAGEFWRRWHISLGQWFKDYIYMPIATASWFKGITKKIRKSRGRQWGIIISVTVPSLAVWVMTGIWHGTGLDYILWGLYWGSIIILSEILDNWYGKIRDRLGLSKENLFLRVFRMGRTFGFYCVGLLINTRSSVAYVDGNLERTVWENGIIIIGPMVLLAVECLQEKFHKQGKTIRGFLGKQRIVVRWTIYLAALMALAVFGRFGVGYDADTFIYASF